jgi:catechol-2,3-dioxygenase
MPGRVFDWLANAKFSVTSKSLNMKVSSVNARIARQTGLKEILRTRIDSLGHVVVKARGLETAEHFYDKVLGIPIQSKSEADQMIFFHAWRNRYAPG